MGKLIDSFNKALKDNKFPKNQYLILRTDTFSKLLKKLDKVLLRAKNDKLTKEFIAVFEKAYLKSSMAGEKWRKKTNEEVK